MEAVFFIIGAGLFFYVFARIPMPTIGAEGKSHSEVVQMIKNDIDSIGKPEHGERVITETEHEKKIKALENEYKALLKEEAEINTRLEEARKKGYIK